MSVYQARESLSRRGGRPRLLRLPGHVAVLRRLLEAEPELKLARRCECLGCTEGFVLSVPTLWRTLRALGWISDEPRKAPTNYSPPSAFGGLKGWKASPFESLK